MIDLPHIQIYKLYLTTGALRQGAGGVELGEEKSLICHSLDVEGVKGRVTIGSEITPSVKIDLKLSILQYQL